MIANDINGRASYRRRSFYDNVEENAENTTRRRSMFECSVEPSKEMDTNWIDEWNRRWNTQMADYVDIAEYPATYVLKLRYEREMWIKGLETVMEKAEEFAGECEYIDVIEGCDLSTYQKVTLQDVDSKISEFREHIKASLEKLENKKRIQQSQLHTINTDIGMLEKMLYIKN